MNFPLIQIRSQPGKIGIDADLGQYEIRQPRAVLEIQSTPAKMEIEQPRVELQIDQSKAWDALGLGGNLKVMSRIYSAAGEAALQGIARIAERGNRLAAIHRGGNPLADLALEASTLSHEINIAGPASVDNVDFFYKAQKPRIEVTAGDVAIIAHPNRPEVTYHRGKLDIYMQHYGQVTITPPQIDLTI